MVVGCATCAADRSKVAHVGEVTSYTGIGSYMPGFPYVAGMIRKRDLYLDCMYLKDGGIINLTTRELLRQLQRPGACSTLTGVPLSPATLKALGFTKYCDCYQRQARCTRFSSWLIHVKDGQLLSLMIDTEYFTLPTYVHELQALYYVITKHALRG